MRLALAAALLLALASGPANAQTAVKVKRRPQPPPPLAVAPAPSLALRPGVSIANAGGRTGGLGANGLAVGGLRAPADGGASCRSGCARNRYACEVADDSCGAQWSPCVKSCSDAAGALLPRE